MSDFSSYHALANQLDPSAEQAQQQQRQQQHQGSTPPGGATSQPTSYAAGGGQPQQQQQYGGYGASPQPLGNSPQLQQWEQSGVETSQMGDLSAQVNRMGLAGGSDAGGVGAMPPAAGRAAGGGGKKKSRHAYHNLEQPVGSSQAYNGIPQDQGASQFLDQSGSRQSAPHPYAGQQITPAMNQFPAPSGGTFIQGSSSGGIGPGGTPTLGPGGAGVGAMRSSTMDVPSGGQGRVDPDQIPSVPRSRDAPAQYYRDHAYATMEQHLPPPGVVPLVVHDQGNSSPKYARLTLNNIPSRAEMLATTALPLGLVLQPLAPLATGESPVPVLDFGDAGPPRCSRCRTYVNPFMTFRAGGNKFVCNMCNFPNDVPPEYFAPTDPSGVRVDRDQRPELRLGTVEFVVPKEYWVKEPMPLRYLFVIDVSQEAINRGFLEAFCDGVLGAIYGATTAEDGKEADDGAENDDDDEQAAAAAESSRLLAPGAQVGFVTFDKEIHFYNCHSALDQPQMMVMPDIEDPFVPLGSDGLFVDPYKSKSVITRLLNQLPRLFSDIKNPEPALLPALTTAMKSLTSSGGKIICSLSALPTWGPGRLFMRDEKNLHGVETERKLFQTENPGYKNVANELVKHGVGVDFFIASPAGVYMDIATIGHVSAFTGGETFFYPNFHAPRDNLKLSLEVKHTVQRETGIQALMKVRCSNGLQVASYHGNFKQHTFGADLEFGNIDADKAIGIMFSYDGKLDSKLDAHFQSALLYTTATGERRVRCTNTVASVSDSPSECMRFVDQDAVVCMIAKEAATRMTERMLKDVRNAITERTIDILAGYRKAFSSNHPTGQLVLPENLKEFAMYMLALLKCKAFKAGIEPSDHRTFTMRVIRSASPLTLSLLLYPRIFSLHDLSPTSGFPDEQTQQLVVPLTLRASYARIQEGGAYLVSDGQTTLLWLHAQVSPNLLEDLFGPGVTKLADISPYTNTLPLLQTHLNAQARNLLAYWGTIVGSRSPTLQLARQGMDGSEFEFARLLVEDRNGEAQSYVDWLVHVHRGVQMELSGQRRKTDDGGGGGGGDGGLAQGLRAMGW